MENPPKANSTKEKEGRILTIKRDIIKAAIS
jgi:hypothetical protein